MTSQKNSFVLNNKQTEDESFEYLPEFIPGWARIKT